MTTTNDTDKFFWLAYCQAIKQSIGTGLDDKTALFFATKAQKGPLASPLIDPTYTNYGIYQLGDNLLNPKNLFYVPSTQNSYIRSLQNYLEYVELDGDQSEINLTRAATTKISLDDAMINVANQRKAAYAEFLESQKMGLTGTQTFPEWAPVNYPPFTNAQVDAQNAAAANDAANAALAGPTAAKKAVDSAKINQALTSAVAAPGIRMSACSQTPSDALSTLNDIKAGRKLAAPTGLELVPQYTSQGYGSTVKAWINEGVSTKPPKNSSVITIEQGRNTSEQSFGQTKAGGSVGFSYAPWVSFNLSGNSEHDESSFSKTLNDNDVTVTLTYDEIRKVDITPGSWNIGNPAASYKLRADAPPITRELAVANQLVLAHNLGYIIKFSQNTKNDFDKKVRDTKSAGGFIRVLGIPISIGGDFSKSTDNTSHAGDWNSDSGELIVKPTPDGAFATIVAILGEKIQTT